MKQPRCSDGKSANGQGSEAEVALTDELSQIERWLPEGTSASWRTLAPVVPSFAYLAGGTALTVHLKHRLSRDLDFFTERSFDTSDIIDAVSAVGVFAPTRVEAGTVNGVFNDTKFQMLDASAQFMLEVPTMFAGLRIAAIEDLLAMKLKVIQDRGELRDYFDIMQIEKETGLSVEEGLGLLVEKYRPTSPVSVIDNVVLGLGYMGDVENDPSLPVGRESIEKYWARRQPQIARSLTS